MSTHAYLRILPADIDQSILERITEAEVVMWLAARMQQIRAELPVHNMSADLHWRCYPDAAEEYIDMEWVGHTKAECTIGNPTSAELCAALRGALHDHPLERASDKRHEAAHLLAQAAELEATAAQSHIL